MQWVRESSGTLINRISLRVLPILIVRLSILNVITLAKCLDHQIKKLLSNFTFALSFLFFSFFFSKPSTWSPWPSPPSTWSSFAPPLRIVLPISWSLEQIGYHLEFHQFTKTKLELSISPFLVIDDNPFTKIWIEIQLNPCCLKPIYHV